MAIAHDFDYSRPSTLAEALQQKSDFLQRARILSGGTDLIVNIKEGMEKPELLIDIKDIADLKRFEVEAEALFIGAAITFRDLIESDIVQRSFPMLWDAAKTVASTGVRSRATLVGNICSAVPSLDSAPPLLCYNASLHCQSIRGSRIIPLPEWFLAPRKTALSDDEIVLGISIPLPIDRSSGIYLKLGRYGGEDLAQAGWAIYLDETNDYRIAHCALAPIPKRAHKIEVLLSGQDLNDELIARAVELVPLEISPITDIRSSSEYRSHVSKVMLKRGLLAVKQRLLGKTIEAQKILGGL